MAEYIRWGILGAADFALNQMGPALHAAPGGRLSALATRSADKAEPFRRIAPDLRVHGDYDTLLADPEIDAVYVPLPNTLHVEWTLKALKAGKHVLCEKPLAMQAGEIDDLIAERDSAGRLAAEGFMIIHHPQWQHVKALIEGGAIGRLSHVNGMFSFDKSGDADNIRNRPETGGGAVRDIGCYVMGSTRFVTGAEPSTVSARIRWENDVDVFTIIDADFPGFTYRAVISTRLHDNQEMLFYGEAGTIRVTAPFNAEGFGDVRVELDRDGGLEVRSFNDAHQYEAQVAAFNHSALTGAAYAWPLEAAKGTQAVLDRVFQSAQTLTT